MNHDHTPNIGGDCGQSADSADNLRTRPTPETDDLLNIIRKLECELAEAVKARDHNRTCVKRLTGERDEAREQLDRICRDGFGYQDTVSLEPCADYVLRKLKDERELTRELAGRIEQILLCKSGPHGWVVGNLSLAAKQAEGSMIKAKEVLP